MRSPDAQDVPNTRCTGLFPDRNTIVHSFKISLKLFHKPGAIVHRHHPDRNVIQVLSWFYKSMLLPHVSGFAHE